MDPQSQDFLLALTGSTYSLCPSQAITMPEKTSSFNNLMSELFNQEHDPESMHVDILVEFANDGEIAEDKFPHRETLEQQKRVQMTQQPEALKNGITKESEPDLPREIMPHQDLTPALAVFRIGKFQQNPVVAKATLFSSGESPSEESKELVELDLLSIDEVLSPVSPQSQMSQVSPTIEQLQELPESYDIFGIQLPSFIIETSATTALNDSELDRKVKFIHDAIKLYHSLGGPVCCNGKLQVHEIVLVLLLAPHDSEVCGVLVFCNKEGNELRRPSENFKAKDTKMMGLIWQKVKNNKNGNYDTFARAMRVGRERNKEYFDYLDAGKAAKKRVYKLGPKCLKEIERMKRVMEF